MFHRVYLRHIRGPFGTEERHNDGEAYGYLSGSDSDDKKEEDMAFVVRLAFFDVEAREGNEREVRCGEHQLEAHENDDQIATHQNTGESNREQNSTDKEEVVQGESGFHTVTNKQSISLQFLLTKHHHSNR